MRELERDQNAVTMYSFDISSLFTNVSLQETIDICTASLFHSNLEPCSISEAVFVELVNTATRAVEFSFNANMYAQEDGAAMGSPLGPPFAKIFGGFHEKRLFHELTVNFRPTVYHRYVDNTFAIFNTTNACTDFFACLNALHPALKFTFETEQSNVLPFIDVLVEKTEDGFLMTMYR